MPADTASTIPVLVHLNPDDWKKFKKLSGHRKASMRVRQLIRLELDRKSSASAK